METASVGMGGSGTRMCPVEGNAFLGGREDRQEAEPVMPGGHADVAEGQEMGARHMELRSEHDVRILTWEQSRSKG